MVLATVIVATALAGCTGPGERVYGTPCEGAPSISCRYYEAFMDRHDDEDSAGVRASLVSPGATAPEAIAGRFVEWGLFEDPPDIAFDALIGASRNEVNGSRGYNTGCDYALDAVLRVEREWQRQFAGREHPWEGERFTPVRFEGNEYWLSAHNYLGNTGIGHVTTCPDWFAEDSAGERSFRRGTVFELDGSVAGLRSVMFQSCCPAGAYVDNFTWAPLWRVTHHVVEARWTCAVEPCRLTWTIQDKGGRVLHEQTTDGPFFHSWQQEEPVTGNDSWNVTARGDIALLVEGDVRVTLFWTGAVPDGYSAFGE